MSTKDIKNRISSISNIKKITETMEHIAAVKVKKNSNRLMESKVYFEKLVLLFSDVISGIEEKNQNWFQEHPLIKAHKNQKNPLILVVSSNRGLCGGYNSHVFELTKKLYHTLEGKKLLYIIGTRGINYFKYQGLEIRKSWNTIDDKVSYQEIFKIANELKGLYLREEIDGLHCIYTRYYSAGSQKAISKKLLPLSIDLKKIKAIDYIFEPSKEEVLQGLIEEVFKVSLLNMMLESHLSEQIARRIAMKQSTDSADEMIKNLKVEYNKARQNKITKELIEILTASKALKN